MDDNRLRPGRHQLSRDEVSTHQRERILTAVESVMAVKGYLGTTVADIIKEAGVSRQTFYQMFTSKQDCFLEGYSKRQGSVIKMILENPGTDSPMQAFAKLLEGYLAVMAAKPGVASLYLVGVYAAGPEAFAQRVEMQRQFVDGVAKIFGATSPSDLFACRTIVAAASTMVTAAVVVDDADAVLALHAPLVEMAERLFGR